MTDQTKRAAYPLYRAKLVVEVDHWAVVKPPNARGYDEVTELRTTSLASLGFRSATLAGLVAQLDAHAELIEDLA